MLDQSILEQVKGIFASLKSEITLNVALAKENEKTAEMRQFIDEFTSVSDRLKAEYNEVGRTGAPLRSGQRRPTDRHQLQGHSQRTRVHVAAARRSQCRWSGKEFPR